VSSRMGMTGVPFRLGDEQARFVMNHYRVQSTGDCGVAGAGVRVPAVAACAGAEVGQVASDCGVCLS
jgi:hypothetical protein